jgi:multidrug efflux pump subunit AcrA (membrane-fusion protein)
MGPQDAIEKLEAKLVEAEAQVAREKEHADEWRERAYKAENEVAETRQQFADLKERVASLGVENAEMKGYISRVQEDDVVREDLIPVGDVATGDVHLTPKRKHRRFAERDLGMAMAQSGSIFASERRPRRHWVNY